MATKKIENKKSALIKIKIALSLLFNIIWIIIGIFILLFIWANFKQGAFKGLFGGAPQQQTPSAAQAPTETDLPGVGKVNIECVQNSLSQETIQKLLTDGGTTNFTAEEKEKLDPCIVASEEATPAESPSK